MAYDQTIAKRVRTVLRDHRKVTEREMFGGVAFMLNGNMCCGVVQNKLMLRLGQEGASGALRDPHTHPMDFTGKAMKSMVYVEAPGFRTETLLRKWVARAVEFVRQLPRSEERRVGKECRL